VSGRLPGRNSEFSTPRLPLFCRRMTYARIDFAAAPIFHASRPGYRRRRGAPDPTHPYRSSSELATMERTAPMTCPTCYWQHTDVNAALVCYRKSNPKPTEDRPRGDRVKPETGNQGVDSGSTKRPSSLSTNPGTSETVFVTVEQERAAAHGCQTSSSAGRHASGVASTATDRRSRSWPRRQTEQPRLTQPEVSLMGNSATQGFSMSSVSSTGSCASGTRTRV